MKKFLIVCLGTPNDEKFKAYMAKPEEERKRLDAEGIEAWGKWLESHKDRVVDAGAPLGKTKQVDEHGITDASNNLSGYGIIMAESLEEAAQMCSNHPHFMHFPGTAVQVMPILEIPKA